MISVIFIVLNAISSATSNVLSGVAARTRPVPVVLAGAGLSSLAIVVVVAAITGGPASATGLSIGFAAGLIGGIALPVAYRAFAIGPVGVTASIVACTGTATLALVGIISGSPVTLARLAGLVLCLGAIILVTRRPSTGESRSAVGVTFAIAAALGFSAFVVLIDRVSESDGLWPLAAARVGIVVVAALLMTAWLTTRKSEPSIRIRVADIRLPVLAGVLDAAANLMLVLALHTGDLVLVAILAPVAPVVTAIIGKAFLRESLSHSQLVGLALGVSAIVFAAV